MSPRKWRHRVRDILGAISRIESYTEGMSFSHFKADPKTIDAVVRNFIIIGEAASRLPEDVKNTHQDIPWRLMSDMRNFAVHEYWGVEVSTIWETILKDLPPLRRPLRALLEDQNLNHG